MHSHMDPRHRDAAYYTSSARDAFVHTLLRSRTKQPPLERSSALTHLAPALVLTGYVLARPHVLPVDSLSALLALAATGATAVTFAVSVAFHLYRYVREWGNWMRTVDTSAIYGALALNGVADLALVSADFKISRWQTAADPVIAATVLFLYFVLRRAVIPWEETRSVYAPLLVIRRVQHADMEHGPLRAGTTALLSLCWIPGIAMAFSVLEPSVAAVWTVGSVVSTATLWFGNVVDSVDPIARRCFCVLGKRCVFDSHAWWHVISTTAALIHIVTREVVLYYRD